ncbi:hypothetical protein DESUT3_00990 [Desulfuromonas versatilis]|uniref:DUF2169 domain-containing protein n=1 Tax=Desulfuromonas versatilis TaxID=2802975 RepID=A0ABN6DS42_9BACT|nr:DUF2169 domain-containing protein [Desulfuromonas versatilis]BCR03030.1 hypothetical protein DESUT3_00990 [Desulfuromonas versatilis]
MLELDNRSGWAAGLYPGWSRDGRRQMTVVVKAAFRFEENGRLAPCEAPPAIEEADRYWSEPGRSSLAAACETVPFKAGGELLVSGTARPARAGATVMEVAVGLRRADDRFWEKKLRVFGPRRWEKGLLGISASHPGPLQPLPLRYESAYGGIDPNHEEQLYELNPAGQGYSQKGWRVKGMALPQIEIGPRFISAPTSRQTPAGFGPIAPFWKPRLSLFDKLDLEAVAWGGCPFPLEVAPELYNAAPPDQRFDGPFSGGEALHLKGLVEGAPPEGILVQVPRILPDLRLAVDGRTEALRAACDTLLVDTDARQLCLLWRSGIPWELGDKRSGWVILRDPERQEDAA